MIKIAILADIHLPYLKGAVQYKALDYAVESIKKHNPDVIVCLGDATACGDIEPAEHFLKIMEKFDKPKLFILGNSDIRNESTLQKINILEVNKAIKVGEYKLLGINTADSSVSEEDKNLLLSTDEKTIVFMHHPYIHMEKESGKFVKNWISDNNYKLLIHGHMHYFEKSDNVYSIQALDPDKAIGEPPCVTYVTIKDDVSFDFDYFYTEKINDIGEYLGLSCFDVKKDIIFATDNGIKNIELRPGAINEDYSVIEENVKYWKSKGGKYLSLHMPDFGYDSTVTGREEWEKATELAVKLGVNGVTVHVPAVSVGKMKGEIKKELILFLKEMIEKLPKDCVVGIENMHMTSGEKDDENRRFGYLPNECVEFSDEVNKALGCNRTGILLDIGHARNNAPFSQRYPLGMWYETVGGKTVGYHAHQVLIKPAGMDNHCPISDFYGPLISYCSFAYCFNKGIINKKPVFLEIRGGIENYKISVETFKN